MKQLFPTGRHVATPGALALLTAPACELLVLRHSTGDWGDVCAEDRRENERSLRDGDRVFSAYVVSGVRVLVITEADRSVTTVLLQSEY